MPVTVSCNPASGHHYLEKPAISAGFFMPVRHAERVDAGHRKLQSRLWHHYLEKPATSAGFFMPVRHVALYTLILTLDTHSEVRGVRQKTILVLGH